MADAKMEKEPELVSMKRPKSRMEKDYAVESSMHEEYGWGLGLRLENFELDALGITQLPAVGAEIPIDAIARVTRVTESSSPGNKGDRTVELQIIKLGIEKS